MATPTQIAEIRKLAVKCIVLPDCPVKKAHAVAARVFMEREVIKLIDNAVRSIQGVAENASG